MRTQNNPLRKSPAPASFRDIVFIVVTHLPCKDDTGYHAERLEVVQTCLTTMRAGAHREHTFMIWDNGSNSTFRDWLQHIFEPDILVMSNNIGKNLARASAVATVPLGSVVCYSDDDIFYYDNWLQPQLDLLYYFPNVAAVSGNPVRTMFRWGIDNTLAWAKENKEVKYKQGRMIPKKWEDDFAVSIGRTPEYQAEYTKMDIDYRATYNGKQAYLTAHHCQFIGHAVKILPALQRDGMAMGDEKPLDIGLDHLGLRLCTTERLTRHIGNVMDDGIRAELERVYGAKEILQQA